MSTTQPHLFVIFGGTGDLTKRKLLPSLYRITMENGVGEDLNILGVSRTDHGDDEYRGWARDALVAAGVDAAAATEWVQRMFYTRVAADEGDLAAVRDEIETIEQKRGLPGNRALYLALPPPSFPDTISMLGEAGLNTSPGWTRLVIEKPFGSDFETAEQLNAVVHDHFTEDQIYRIDHYLGKETVQNVLAFRFSNLLFESAWSRDRIHKVEITVAEEIGIEGRSGYYERAGVMRDMVQNHLTQLLTLVAMEAPHSFNADAIRTEKVQALQAVTVDPDHVVFGQYTEGVVDGEEIPGYLDEEGVAADSTTATFVALRLAVNSWRWQGVPFYLRTGKRMPRKTTQIVVTFQRPPVCLFHGVEDECEMHSNVLILTLQPDEGFELRFDVKAPGEPLHLVAKPLHFDYEEAFESIPDAYQTLLYDVISGDQTLFVRSDEVETSWQLWDELIDMPATVHAYAAGTWGPEQTDIALGRPGESWTLSD